MRRGQPAALALRHDVDICLYQPDEGSGGGGGDADWRLVHKGTLNAFGYVQASKEQKKYMQCSADMSYAVIAEAQRHVFFYHSQYGVAATQLKNRKNGGGAAIGQQKLYTLDANEQIVGMMTEPEATFLLTETEVICLQIKVN